MKLNIVTVEKFIEELKERNINEVRHAFRQETLPTNETQLFFRKSSTKLTAIDGSLVICFVQEIWRELEAFLNDEDKRKELFEKEKTSYDKIKEKIEKAGLVFKHGEYES